MPVKLTVGMFPFVFEAITYTYTRTEPDVSVYVTPELCSFSKLCCVLSGSPILEVRVKFSKKYPSV